MRGNIEFSKLNQAILENSLLASYVSYRLANVSVEEGEAGKIAIELDTGNILTLSFKPTKVFKKALSVPTPS